MRDTDNYRRLEPSGSCSAHRYASPVTRAATPAIAALIKAAVAHEVLTYHHDARTESYGEEAVAVLPVGSSGGHLRRVTAASVRCNRASPMGMMQVPTSQRQRDFLRCSGPWHVTVVAPRRAKVLSPEFVAGHRPSCASTHQGVGPLSGSHHHRVGVILAFQHPDEDPVQQQGEHRDDRQDQQHRAVGSLLGRLAGERG